MSKKKFPALVKFFIADDIRADDAAKPMLLGFFPDDVVIISMPSDAPNPTKDKPIVLGGLAILVAFIDCRGPFVVKVSLYRPDGLPIFEKNKIEGGFGDSNSPEQGSMNFITKFMPFSIPSFGKYRFVIELDNKGYPFEFTLIRRASATISKRLTSLSAKKQKNKSPYRSRPG